MRRREFIAGAAAAATMTITAPSLVRAKSASTLTYVPRGDLPSLDPVYTTAYTVRDHAYLVFDTLFGMDRNFNIQPQMAEGVSTSTDGKTVSITLRDGLRFHDKTPVLARDCVASIKRWGVRDTLGQALMAATDELTATSDKEIQFRLKRPFPLLTAALGKIGSNVPVIMPERLAQTSPFEQVKEVVGSGPFRFAAGEHLPGAQIVYEKFADYVPRSTGTPSMTAGPKVAYFDRVEWQIIPDASTVASALISGQVDWWIEPVVDLFPMLTRAGVTLQTVEFAGTIPVLRPNFLYPPFDNPEFRRALLPAINQQDYVVAAGGPDPKLWKVPVGAWTPGSPMATDVGLKPPGEPDWQKIKAAVKASGYNGEKVILLLATNYTMLNAVGLVAADAFAKAGVNVDVQSMDFATVVQRSRSRNAPGQGGWNAFCTGWSGLDELDPAVSPIMRGNGEKAWAGWPEMPKLEELRNAWLEAPDLESRKKIAAELQQAAFHEVPFYQLGQLTLPTAHKGLKDVLEGLVFFWNVKRA